MTKYDKNVYKTKLKKIDEKLATIKKATRKTLIITNLQKRQSNSFAFRLATELVAAL